MCEVRAVLFVRCGVTLLSQRRRRRQKQFNTDATTTSDGRTATPSKHTFAYLVTHCTTERRIITSLVRHSGSAVVARVGQHIPGTVDEGGWMQFKTAPSCHAHPHNKRQITETTKQTDSASASMRLSNVLIFCAQNVLTLEIGLARGIVASGGVCGSRGTGDTGMVHHLSRVEKVRQPQTMYVMYCGLCGGALTDTFVVVIDDTLVTTTHLSQQAQCSVVLPTAAWTCRHVHVSTARMHACTATCLFARAANRRRASCAIRKRGKVTSGPAGRAGGARLAKVHI